MLDDGRLDIEKLMGAFQAFWRKDGHLVAAGFQYREAGPHLMLMAFLQRVVNGGGRVKREYGLGRGALPSSWLLTLDLTLLWQGQVHTVEVKLRRDRSTEADALEQVCGYLDVLGIDEGWLVLFDLRSSLSWAERLYRRDEKIGGKTVHLVGGEGDREEGASINRGRVRGPSFSRACRDSYCRHTTRELAVPPRASAPRR